MIPKYRAWSKATKAMYDDGDIVDVDIEKKEILVKTTSYKRLSYSFLGDVELMASTGFRDNDGKDIFRGDIVMSRCGLFKGIVSLRQDLGAYVVRSIGYKYFKRLRDVASSVVVIGNFYENPEILEVRR